MAVKIMLRLSKASLVSLKNVLVFIIIASYFDNSSAKKSASHNFMAQPFGQVITEQVELGSIKCIFTYKCVGGTGEGWEMKLQKKKSEYHCVIDRPEQSSYLFFMMFEASIEGTELIRAEPYDNTKKMLHDDEFKVEGNTVKSDSGFKSNLATLALIARRHR